MVLRSWPVRRAMAETDRPCRARSRIMTSSPRVTTGCSQDAEAHPGPWPALPGPGGSPPGPGSGAEPRNFQPALPGRIHPAATKAIYVALGVRHDGTKDVLGLWMEQTEGARFWLRVMNELKDRGVQDILIAVVDGLKGFPE